MIKMANQGIDYKQKNDRLHVMLNEKVDTIVNFRQQITKIDQDLNNAQNSLANVPGVEAALTGIQRSKEENYQRLVNVQAAEKAENDLFLTIAKHYRILEQAVSVLNIPQPNEQPPQLTMNQQVQNQTKRDSATRGNTNGQ